MEKIINLAIELGKEAARYKARKEAKARYIGFKILYYQYLFGDTAEEERMPPTIIYQDGYFVEKKYCLEYRFKINNERTAVYAKTKEKCYKKRYELETGKTTKKIGLTFKQWIIEWHKLYDNKNSNDKTKKQKESYINDIKENLGNINLAKLTGSTIQGYLNTYNDRKNTKYKIAQIIKAAVKMAIKLGKLKSDPFATVVAKKHKGKKRRPLTFDEQNLVYNNISPQYFHLFKFCCCTGLRISEALMIRKKDIDYETGQIFALRLKKEEETTAPVPFLPELLDFEFADKLFEGLTYNGFKCYLQDFYKKVNIKGVLIHNFRSTFASLCYAAGIPLKYIQEWLCHATLAMTADTYTHLIKNGKTSPLYEYIKRLKKHLEI